MRDLTNNFKYLPYLFKHYHVLDLLYLKDDQVLRGIRV